MSLSHLVPVSVAMNVARVWPVVCNVGADQEMGLQPRLETGLESEVTEVRLCRHCCNSDLHWLLAYTESSSQTLTKLHDKLQAKHHL